MRSTLLLALLFACAEAPTAPAPEAPAPAEPPAPVLPSELPDTSLYQAGFTIVDQDGQASGLDRHLGHPVVAGMFYATCEHTCPVLLETIRAFVDGLPPELKDDVRVLMVSFAQDDPATLSQVMERHGFDRSRWTLARTEPERVRELAMLLDVTYRRSPDGGFNHTSGFTVLDGTGVVRAQIPDMNASTEPLRDALEQIARSRSVAGAGAPGGGSP